jgi:uncharacterized protein (TIGR03437 family)
METMSTNLPMVDPIQAAPGGDQDAAVIVLDPTGSNLIFSTYLGGNLSEQDPDLFLWQASGAKSAPSASPTEGRRKAIADDVAIYVVGETDSANFPTTAEAYDTSFSGVIDHYITKIVNAIEVEEPLAPVTTVSAASFTAPIAAESIASAFAAIPVDEGMGAPGTPLPTELGGVTARIVDSQETEWQAELFYAGPTQVNFFVPGGVAPGNATVNILVNGEVVATGEVEILAVAPGVFFVGQQPQVAAAFSLTIAPDGARTQAEVFEANLSPRAIDLGPDGTQVYLLLFGTGIRNGTTVSATVGGADVPLLGYVPHSVFVGLDQVNIGPLPRSLIARGEVEVALTVDSAQSNPVIVKIQ